MKERLKTVSDAGYQSIVKEIEWKKDCRLEASRNWYVKRPQILSTGKTKKLAMPDPTRRCVFERDPTVLSERFSSDYSTVRLTRFVNLFNS